MERERQRVDSEFKGQRTIENRSNIDRMLARFAPATYRDDEHEAQTAKDALCISVVFEGIQGALVEVPRILRSRGGDPDKRYANLGNTMLHGLKVLDWLDRSRGEPLTPNNRVAAVISLLLLEGMKKKDVKKMAGIFTGLGDF